jgi:hypothetical protein
MNFSTRAGVATLLALLWCAPAAAQERIDSPYRFLDHTQGAGAVLGYFFANQGRLGAGPASSPAAGLRYGIVVTGPIQVELEGLFAPTTRTVVDTSFTTPDSTRVTRGEADMSLLIAMASLRLNVTGQRTWRGVQPFALFGIGVASDLSGLQGADDAVAADARFDFGTSFAGSLGAGLEWYPAQHWSLRADARTLLWKLKAPAAFRLQNDAEADRVIPADEWEQNGLLSAGIAFHF